MGGEWVSGWLGRWVGRWVYSCVCACRRKSYTACACAQTINIHTNTPLAEPLSSTSRKPDVVWCVCERGGWVGVCVHVRVRTHAHSLVLGRDHTHTRLCPSAKFITHHTHTHTHTHTAFDAPSSSSSNETIRFDRTVGVLRLAVMCEREVCAFGRRGMEGGGG